MTESLFKLQVSLLLDSLGILKPLDEFHFQFLHLGDFVHLAVAQLLLLLAPFLMLSPGYHLLASLLLFYFHLGESLRLQADLVLHFVFLFNSEIILSLLDFILLLNHFRLLGLLLLLEHKSILNFFLLIIPLLGHHVVILALLPLLLIGQLNVEDFLRKS